MAVRDVLGQAPAGLTAAARSRRGLSAAPPTARRHRGRSNTPSRWNDPVTAATPHCHRSGASPCGTAMRPRRPKTIDHRNIDFDVVGTLLSFYVRSVNRLVSQDLDEQTAELGLSGGTGKISTILLVGANPGIRPSVIAYFIRKDRSAMGKLLEQMERGGFDRAAGVAASSVEPGNSTSRRRVRRSRNGPGTWSGGRTGTSSRPLDDGGAGPGARAPAQGLRDLPRHERRNPRTDRVAVPGSPADERRGVPAGSPWSPAPAAASAPPSRPSLAAGGWTPQPRGAVTGRDGPATGRRRRPSSSVTTPATGESQKAWVAATVARFGRIDAVVANAGILIPKSVDRGRGRRRSTTSTTSTSWRRCASCAPPGPG